jgi:hypothetical protein
VLIRPATIARAIRDECRARRRLPDDVLEAAGLPPNFLDQAQRSRYRVSAGQLVLVAQALGIGPHALIERATEIQRTWTNLNTALPAAAAQPDVASIAAAISDPPTRRLLLTAAPLVEFAPCDLAGLVGRDVSAVAARVLRLREDGLVVQLEVQPGRRGSLTNVYRVADSVRELLEVIDRHGLCASDSAERQGNG